MSDLKLQDGIKAYRCMECHKLIDPEEKEFVIVEGNIYLRKGDRKGGIVGDNFDAVGKIVGSTKFHLSCFQRFVAELKSEN